MHLEQAKRFVQALHHHRLAVADLQLKPRIVAIELIDFVLRGHEDSILTRIDPKLPATFKQSKAWYGEGFDAG